MEKEKNPSLNDFRPAKSWSVKLLLFLVLQIRTEPHLGCCLAAATAVAPGVSSFCFSQFFGGQAETELKEAGAFGLLFQQ
jgi:hypothetical protein